MIFNGGFVVQKCCIRESEVENFDTEERLKQVERLKGGEAKVAGERKGKVGMSEDDLVIRVVNAVVGEHAEFEKVDSNHINENDIHKIIETTRYSSFKKLMMVTRYVLRFIKNISNKVNKIIEEINADEYNIALKLWIKNEQSLLKFERNFDKLHKSLKSESHVSENFRQILNFLQPCSKKYHHLFVCCLKLKINEF